MDHSWFAWFNLCWIAIYLFADSSELVCLRYDKQGFKSWWDVPWDTRMGYHLICLDKTSHRHLSILIGMSWDIFCSSVGMGWDGMAARPILGKNQDNPIPHDLKIYSFLIINIVVPYFLCIRFANAMVHFI